MNHWYSPDTERFLKVYGINREIDANLAVRKIDRPRKSQAALKGVQTRKGRA
jgi:hypothetical protein